MNKDLVAIFEYLETEKGIKREIVIKAIEDSLHLAAKKSVNGATNTSVKVDPKTGEIEVVTEKEIVEKVEYPEEEISLAEAQELDSSAEVGQWIEITVTPASFGRIAAQTARQVIAQKLRGAERDVIYKEYRDRVGDIVSGTIKRIGRGNTLIVDLGKVEAILPDRFVPKTEKHHVGERIVAVLLEVKDTESGGAEAVLSRTHPQMVEELFKQEVPEIREGQIQVIKIVREAGYRTKMAVSSDDPKLDPVGACVGVRGTRVKNVIRELGNEKIDIFAYSGDIIELLQRSLSPIEIKKINVEDETVSIVVADEDYPAALGKRGINARLNGELIGARLEIEKMSEHQKQLYIQRKQMSLGDEAWLNEPLEIEGLNKFVLDSLLASDKLNTPRKLLSASVEDIMNEAQLTREMAEDILEQVRKKGQLKD